MAKKICSLVSLFLLVLLLQGCMRVNWNVGESITPPQNQKIPIQGTWKIVNYKIYQYPQKEAQLKERLGTQIIFHQDIASLGDEICEEPEYKLKTVNSKDYFLYIHKMNAQDLEIPKGSVEVISVTSKQKHFYDFIKVKEDELIVFIEGVFYNVKKLSDQVDPRILQKLHKHEDVLGSQKQKGDTTLHSGVMIGLCSENENPYISEEYRTLWIATNDEELYPVVEMEPLLVPRQSGFWIIGKNRMIESGKLKDKLFAYPLQASESNDETHSETQSINIEENEIRKILFVGNDYISTAYGTSKSLKNLVANELKIIVVNALDRNQGITFSNIEGERGRAIFMNSAYGYLAGLQKEEEKELQEPREDQIAVARKNGHWIMQGRLNYKDKLRKNDYLDFNINTIPPYKIVRFDDLYVSWNEIKSKVPNAIDAYTSPNEDIAIILTKEELYVYGLKENELSKEPIKKIDLKKNEHVVMAEWAIGKDYVRRWNDIISNRGSNIH